jgi:predicted house-cleaning noncanonical NTP pyrophosphatase (MazG superfamily)
LLGDDQIQGTEESTLEEAADSFDQYLSSLEEDKAPVETPPTQESPASEKPEDAESASEPDDAEGESAETEKSDDADAETPESPTIDPATRVRVKIDGEEIEVTLEEALKGYSRTSDYTRKTQELAAQRQAAESEFQGVRGERAKYAELITQVEQALVDLTGPEPDWAKIQLERPNDFPTEWAQWQQRQTEIKQLAEERQRAQGRVAEDQAATLREYTQQQQAKLLEALPEWKDAEKAKSEKAAIVAYAEKAGFSREELSEVRDHRAIVMLRKAMLYDKAQAAKPAIAARIEKVRTATPGPSKQAPKAASPGAAARQRLAKSGSIDDAAAGFESMLGDDL